MRAVEVTMQLLLLVSAVLISFVAALFSAEAILSLFFHLLQKLR
jgi:hypothetical protein